MSFEDELRRLARSDPDFKDNSVERALREFEAKVRSEAQKSTLTAFERQLGSSEIESWIKSVAHAYGAHITTKRVGVVVLTNDPLGWDFIVPIYYSFQPLAIGNNIVRLRAAMMSRISPSSISGFEYRFLFQPSSRRINFDPRSDRSHIEITPANFSDVAFIADIVKCLATKNYDEGKIQLDAAEICGGTNHEWEK